MDQRPLLLINNMIDDGERDPAYACVMDSIHVLAAAFHCLRLPMAFTKQSTALSIVEPLNQYKSAPVFQITGLSAFFCAPFREFISQHRIGTLYLCGAELHSCILKTAMDANDWNRSLCLPIVVEDACYESEKTLHLAEATFTVLSAHPIDRVCTQQVIHRLNSRLYA